MRHRQERQESWNEPSSDARSWLELLGPADAGSPLLIVADNDVIASEALRWDAALTPSGWCYRVRLASSEAVNGDDEAAAVANEAASLAARSMLAVGDQNLVAMARKAAALAGVSLVSVGFSRERGQGGCQ